MDSSLPLFPEFVRGKRPVDVYKKLIDSQIIEKRIFHDLEISTVSIKADVSNEIVPPDVYDLASLMISELKFLHEKIVPDSKAKKFKTVKYPGRKLSSHVF